MSAAPAQWAQFEWVVFGIGNRSRGDDAAGPLILDWLADQPPPPGGWLLLEVFQLQPEHVLDMAQGRQVLFVDACLGLPEGWRLDPCVADPAPPAFSHQLSPGQLLAACQQILDSAPPLAWTLRICAESTDLGTELSPRTFNNLQRLMPDPAK